MTTLPPSSLTSSISVYTMPVGPDSFCTTQAFMTLQLESGFLRLSEVGDLSPVRGDILHRRRLIEVGTVVLEQCDALHLAATHDENRCAVGAFLGAQVGHDGGDELGRELFQHFRR